MSVRRIHVVAGVLFDAAGRVLVAQRPSGAHLEGLWEFPGGKLKPGELREDGLVRELGEELGIRVLAACPLIWVEHRYPGRDIVLDVWSVESFSGEPRGCEGQSVEWRDVRSLDSADFPPADAPVLAALRLPRRYLVTPEPGRDWSVFLNRLADRVGRGFDLVQLRAKSLDESALAELGRQAARICRFGGAKLLVNADPELARRCGADGVHLTSRRLAGLVRGRSAEDLELVTVPGNASALRSEVARRSSYLVSPGREPRHAGGLAAETGHRSGMKGLRDARDRPLFLIGASCHDAGDLDRARAAGCDFAVLGPVEATPTHPGAQRLRWNGFKRLARGAGMPVYAIGGLGDDDVPAALRSGGQGVAAIRAFWGED